MKTIARKSRANQAASAELKTYVGLRMVGPTPPDSRGFLSRSLNVFAPVIRGAAAIALSLALASSSSADGLLGDETASPYAPEKAEYAVNDIIKITVNESSLATASAGTEVDKETRLIAALQDFVQLTSKGTGLPDLKPGLADGELRIDGRATYSRDNEGETSGSSRIVFTVAAKVIEVLDNGNLVVAARKEVTVNDETVTMTVTGEVAPDDIAPDRTVTSAKVADVKIKRTGSGTVNDAQKRGFFSWLLEVLWPF